MSKRWATSTKRASAKEQNATRHTQTLAECQHGRHRLSKTFRPGEEMCLTCGVVFSCPGCLNASKLDPVPNGRAYALECATHRTMEVQA
jgi:hypothetical protein